MIEKKKKKWNKNWFWSIHDVIWLYVYKSLFHVCFYIVIVSRRKSISYYVCCGYLNQLQIKYIDRVQLN